MSAQAVHAASVRVVGKAVVFNALRRGCRASHRCSFAPAAGPARIVLRSQARSSLSSLWTGLRSGSLSSVRLPTAPLISRRQFTVSPQAVVAAPPSKSGTRFVARGSLSSSIRFFWNLECEFGAGCFVFQLVIVIRAMLIKHVHNARGRSI